MVQSFFINLELALLIRNFSVLFPVSELEDSDCLPVFPEMLWMLPMFVHLIVTEFEKSSCSLALFFCDGLPCFELDLTLTCA